jgi:hypothetical protein
MNNLTAEQIFAEFLSLKEENKRLRDALTDMLGEVEKLYSGDRNSFNARSAIQKAEEALKESE